MDDAKQRRLKWAQEKLDCDPMTGEPGYQELILPEDLVYAMEAEAEHWQTENARLRAVLRDTWQQAKDAEDARDFTLGVIEDLAEFKP